MGMFTFFLQNIEYFLFSFETLHDKVKLIVPHHNNVCVINKNRKFYILVENKSIFLNIALKYNN